MMLRSGGGKSAAPETTFGFDHSASISDAAPALRSERSNRVEFPDQLSVVVQNGADVGSNFAVTSPLRSILLGLSFIT